MITNLIWRCPLCKTNDSLQIVNKFLSKSLLSCQECKTSWQIERVIGQDYRLKVISSPAYPEQAGIGHNLAEWYSLMKKTIRLDPLPTIQYLQLLEGENLYISSKKVRLNVQSNDPVFFPEAIQEDASQLMSTEIGAGQLFLTNQRFIWRGVDHKEYTFSLEKLASAYANANIALVLLYDMRLYEFRFLQESMLKWLTYFALVGKEYGTKSGHTITTSNY